MHVILSKAFWTGIWSWCKINWKFIVGFAIPCIVLYFVNQKKATRVFRKGIEFRKNQLETERRASEIKDEMTREAIEEHLRENSELDSNYRKELSNIEKQKEEKINQLDTADKVTSEINKRLGE